QPERRLDPFRVLFRSIGELLQRQRPRRDHEQRLYRAREPVDGVVDKAQSLRVGRRLPERAHAAFTVIGSNGASWAIETSPPLRSSSSARNATACWIDDNPSTSRSKTNSARRFNTARKRSRKRPSGGKVSVRWRSEGSGGSAANARRASASFAGSSGRSGRSRPGVTGAGPSLKNRSCSDSSRSSSQAAADLKPRLAGRREATSSAAYSWSSTR